VEEEIKMIRRILGIAMAALLLVSAMAGCGSAMDQATTAAMPAVPAANQAESYAAADMQFSREMDGGAAVDKAGGTVDAFGGTKTDNEAKAAAQAAGSAEEPAVGSLAGTGSTIENVSNAILAERKIIRSANLTIEVENFDEAYNKIEGIILGIGIVQDSNVTTNKIYIEDQLKLVKSGTIVLRVNKDKFDSVINNLKGIGEVYNLQINGQDVTDQYIDTESKLRLLKLEQSKLEAYLEKLDDLDKIFRVESRLTEIRQEIESLTGNLKKMSSLVELSTITLTLNEKYPDSANRYKTQTYWDRLLNNLKSSLESVGMFLGDLLVFIIAAIPVLVVFGLFILLGVFIYRRIPRRKRAPYAPPGNIVENRKDEQHQERNDQQQ
jgi:hypothetical protein